MIDLESSDWDTMASADPERWQLLCTAIDEVLALHTSEPGVRDCDEDVCLTCGTEYPCATRRALQP